MVEDSAKLTDEGLEQVDDAVAAGRKKKNAEPEPEPSSQPAPRTLDQAQTRFDEIQKELAAGPSGKRKRALRAESKKLKEDFPNIRTGQPLPEFTEAINEDHIFGGHVSTSSSGTQHAKGLHHTGRIDPDNVRVTPTSPPDGQGVYQSQD